MAAYAVPAGPVEAALLAVFQDATLQGLAVGGVFSDVPEDPQYPFLWFEVIEPAQAGGFGTKPGLGTLPELEVRLHVISQYQGGLEAQAILSRAIALISASDALTVSGYTVCGTEPFHDATIAIVDDEIKGVKVKEFVSLHRLYVEEHA